MDNAAIFAEIKKAGLISPEDHDRATRAAHLSPDSPSPLFHARALNAIAEDKLVGVLANSAKVEGWLLEGFTPPVDLVDQVGPANMRLMGIVPVKRVVDKQRTTITVGMIDPHNADHLDTLRILFDGATIEPRIVSPYDHDRLMSNYGTPSQRSDERAGMQSIEALISQMTGLDAVTDLAEEAATEAINDEIDSAPIVQVVDGLIARAVTARASDIHLEPLAAGFQVRFRIDGSLQVETKIASTHAKAIVTVIKNKAKMDMTDRIRPQDGRIRVRVQNRLIDLRVSSIPGRHGEKVVIRILDHNTVRPEIESLGMEEVEREKLLSALVSPQGLILVTGPTGSGKTTTLYAILHRLNRPDVNILTVEDPVEYEMAGITQVATNDKAGMAFADALKAFLRQDPDIIMVGEIRDAETAETAMRAALTGHLVLSTIHTNDAAEALTRLVDLGVERANLAGSARLMIAQRLLRRLCLRCRVKSPPGRELIAPMLRDQQRVLEMAREPEAIQAAQEDLAAMERWFTEHESFFFAANPSGGCIECHHTGYRGRVGVYELLEVTEDIRGLIVGGAPALELRKLAQQQGMRTLREVALMHAANGTTSLQEVIENTI